jgi:UDP:flavonoid glycosyltransferase YjiC (YdhE family)
MSEMLLVTWDGGGNVPPALALAGELAGRGHAVRVLGHAGVEPAVRAAGLPFAAFGTARPFSSAASNSPVALVRTFGDRAMGADVVAELDARPADLVVVDCLLFGAMDALARRGTPYVVLEHFFDGYLRGPGLKNPIGVGLRLRGLRPTRLLDGARVCLVATLRELDPGTATRPNVAHTGPFVTGVPAAPSTPTVLLSLSTYRFPGLADAWQRALDAVAELPVRVIATTGPVVDPAALRPGANTELRAWAPHDEVMPDATVLVGHGGHSTTMLALAHDLPMLVIPMFALADQPLVGRAVAGAGAGLTLPKRAKPAEIRAAVERLLHEPEFRVAAARLGARVRALEGLHRGADLVEQQLAAGNAAMPPSTGSSGRSAG